MDMTNREPTATSNLDKTSGAEPLRWRRARDLLDAGALADAASFLGTVRPDGRPHSARIGAAWYDGSVYFQTGRQTRKARNLEVNPACTLSTSLTGIDLVFEGVAELIADGATLEAVAAVWREGGWAAEVSGDGIVAPYNAPATGPPPWRVYRVAAHAVFGVATAAPYGATRWRFADGA
jgi:pyridoxamine 5'-phosphate oxidase-like protein